MIEHHAFIIDAFAEHEGEGNPAAVVFLNNWPADSVMQAIAHDQGLSETAFLIPAIDEDVDYRLRWFTPTAEMDLCGHATLAAAAAVRELAKERGAIPPNRVVFTTRSGKLAVTADEDSGKLELDFPARPPAPVNEPALFDLVGDALGGRPEILLRARDLLAVFASRDDVAALHPHSERVAALGVHAVIATAPGTTDERDNAAVVSRFFAPEKGVNEDPVTGSAHCTLVPYWAQRLGRSEFVARQISQRGGTIWCRHRPDDERVDLAGLVRIRSSGTITMPIRKKSGAPS